MDSIAYVCSIMTITRGGLYGLQYVCSIMTITRGGLYGLWVQSYLFVNKAVQYGHQQTLERDRFRTRSMLDYLCRNEQIYTEIERDIEIYIGR